MRQVRDKKRRMNMIINEFIELWEKFSFLKLSKQVIMSKLRTLIAGYEKNRKKKKESFTNEIESYF